MNSLDLTQVSANSLLLVGKVIGPQGLGGLLRICSYSGSEASFLDAGTVFLESVSGEINEYAVTSVRPHKNAFLMKLEGLSSRDEGEKYKSAGIFISKEAITSGEDEYFCLWYGEHESINNSNECEARGLMLIYLLENGLYKQD